MDSEEEKDFAHNYSEEEKDFDDNLVNKEQQKLEELEKLERELILLEKTLEKLDPKLPKKKNRRYTM